MKILEEMDQDVDGIDDIIDTLDDIDLSEDEYEELVPKEKTEEEKTADHYNKVINKRKRMQQGLHPRTTYKVSLKEKEKIIEL